MASFTPPATLTDPRAVETARREPAPAPSDVKPKKITHPGPAARAAAERRAMEQAETSAKLVPDRLVVEKDESAGRFVQTLVDSQTKEVRWRYPSETQLAYSRAVAAYLRAMTES